MNSYYYIDGYNLLFSLNDSSQSLQSLREQFIRFLQKQFAFLKLAGMVVFDGAHRREEERGLSYSNPLEIAYAPKGQSADEYILEKLSALKNRRQTIVVTNDKGLKAHARAFGAQVLSNSVFIHQLQKRTAKRKVQKVEIKETQYQLNRLLKIFEERLQEDSNEEF